MDKLIVLGIFAGITLVIYQQENKKNEKKNEGHILDSSILSGPIFITSALTTWVAGNYFYGGDPRTI